MTRRQLIAGIVCPLLLIWIAGCGGGGGGSSQSSPAVVGSLTLTTNWLTRDGTATGGFRSTDILVQTTLQKAGQVVKSQLYQRKPTNLDQPQSQATFTGLPAGSYDLLMVAYNAATPGASLVQLDVPVTIGGGTTSLTVSPGATVNALAFPSSTISLTTSGGVQLSAIGYTDTTSGIVALTPLTLQNWTSSATTIASVSSSGFLSALAQGTSQISVTDSISGKSATATVNVNLPGATGTLINYDPTKVFESGSVVDDVNANNAPVRSMISDDSQVDFVVTGSTAYITCVTTIPQNVRFLVDGQYTGGPGSNGVLHSVLLFQNLTDGPHTVSIQKSGVGRFAYQKQGMLSVIGASPSLNAPPSSLWGNQVYPVAQNSQVVSSIRAEAATFTPSSLDRYTRNLVVSETYSLGSLMFNINGTGVSMWVLQNGGVWSAKVDGQRQTSDIPLANTGKYGWVDMVTSLTSGPHEIILTEVTTIEGPGRGLPKPPARVYGFRIPGGSLTNSTPRLRPILAVFGHSIVAGKNLTTMRDTSYFPLADARDYAFAERGLSGNTYLSYSASSPITQELAGMNRLHEIISVQPAVCLIDAFVNDAIARRNAGQVPSNFAPQLTSDLNGLLQACPNTRFFVYDILPFAPSAASVSVNLTAWDQSIAGIVSTVNSPRCRLVPQSQTPTWNPAASQDTVDGLHPNPGGNIKVRNTIQSILNL